jgi:DNA polymerase-3 subunit epsilon
MLKTFLHLDRPLVWLDVETDSFLPPEQSRIVDFGFRMIYPEEEKPDKIYQSLINPGRPITSEARKKHGITDEAVAGKPFFTQIADSLQRGFEGVDYGGYNVKFDLKVLTGEMKRAGVEWDYESARILDPLRLWQVSVPRTLTDAVREFLNREPTDAHRAMGDVEDVHDVFLAMLERFRDLPRDVQKLHDLAFPIDPESADKEGKFKWRGDECVITFGKHNGTPIQSVPRGYLQYIIDNDFASSTKEVCRQALMGNFPKR